MGIDWLPTVGLKEVKDKRIIFKLLAEMIGTMVLVFFSCGSAENDGGMANNGANIVRFSLTFGFTVATMAQVRCFLKLNSRNINDENRWCIINLRKSFLQCLVHWTCLGLPHQSSSYCWTFGRT